MKKFNWWIAGCVVFAILFLGKSCKSCSDNRRHNFNESNYATQLDSIQKLNQEAWDSIKVLNVEITSLKEQKGLIEDNLKNTQSQNQTLINTNHNLSKNKN